MSYWPDTGAGVPPPELVAAWLQLDALQSDGVPLWAAHWLAADYDGEALVQLACLHRGDSHDIRELLPAALAECGIATDLADANEIRDRAAAMIAFDAIARLHIDGLASAHTVIRAVVEIVEPDFPGSTTDLPLGGLYLLDDEWGAGWGRTREDLRDEVWRACCAQLGLAPGTPRRTMA